ncbi:hypothetical protein BLA29_002003 [Euroglyphus maynei]|uniref:Uncharacterized protein n=1 Tax=Euroglyphus maynei TaxID=6958 RepID=A0A1Y3B7S7_EURMA|nr:hypothetical protein BLA29_002003 [Euroglyphus maynei]
MDAAEVLEDLTAARINKDNHELASNRQGKFILMNNSDYDYKDNNQQLKDKRRSFFKDSLGRGLQESFENNGTIEMTTTTSPSSRLTNTQQQNTNDYNNYGNSSSSSSSIRRLVSSSSFGNLVDQSGGNSNLSKIGLKSKLFSALGFPPPPPTSPN